jgi:hypothetical protein
VCSGSEYITAGGVTGVTPTSTAQAHALRQAVKGLAPPRQRTTVTKTVATAVDTTAAHLLMRVQAAQSAPLKAVGDSPPYEPCAQVFLYLLYYTVQTLCDSAVRLISVGSGNLVDTQGTSEVQ